MTASGIILVFFMLLFVAHLVSEAAGSRAGRYITKPLLMPALISTAPRCSA